MSVGERASLIRRPKHETSADEKSNAGLKALMNPDERDTDSRLRSPSERDLDDRSREISTSLGEGDLAAPPTHPLSDLLIDQCKRSSSHHERSHGGLRS